MNAEAGMSAHGALHLEQILETDIGIRNSFILRLPPSQFQNPKIFSFSQIRNPKSFFPTSEFFYMPYALRLMPCALSLMPYTSNLPTSGSPGPLI